MLRSFAILAIFGSCAVASKAADLLPADRPIPAVVDHYVDELLKLDGVEPAPPADDATLVRRLTLDLVGRIPTAPEVESYLASTDPDKRAKLVDRLIASPGFARHQGAMFDAMLNATAGDGGKSGSVREYLQAALADGKSWDAIFRDLLLPAPQTEPVDKKAKKPSPASPAAFLQSRLADADKLTNDVSVAFFGVNVSCAQCHDHPLVADWKQDHFYGMKSFFARTYDASGFLAERSAGVVKFKPIKGPERTAKLMFLTGTEVSSDTLRELTKDEQKKEKDAVEQAKAKKVAPASPAFSARQQLVDLALKEKESTFFARSLANRMWHRFFGFGLVNPLDQMHSENPPSHPELLDWLARDARTHGYDVRRIARGLVLSKAYARSSKYPSESHPAPRYFAVARLKPMTPMQLGTSLRIAVQDPATFEKLKPEDFEKRIEQAESAGRGLAGSFAVPSDDFQIGVAEALLFSNAERLNRDLLGDGKTGVVAKAAAAKSTDDGIALLVQTAYGRPASPEEARALGEYVRRRSDRTTEAYRQVLWALLSAPEFRFSY